MISVSVVVPTRNRSALLATTLRSVLRQRDVDLEVIVIDEASSDDTAEVVGSFTDRCLTMLRNSVPGGPSAARNRGARHARGEWLAFVDDDDLWAPDKLVSQISAAENTRLDWAYAGVVNIGGGFEIVSGWRPPLAEAVMAALPHYNAIPGGGSNVIFRRRLLTEIGGFDDRLPPCEDWEMWLRLARVGPPAVVARPLVGYRVHRGNASLDVQRILRAVRMIEELHATAIDWGRIHRWLAESCLRFGCRTQALSHFARAASRGQLRGVASDMAVILRRRLTSGSSNHNHASRRSEQAWIAEASVWLRELQRCPD